MGCAKLSGRSIWGCGSAGLGQLVRYDELGIYRLLCTIGDMQQLMGFARGVLGSLLDYDTEHRTELVHTLSVYLHHHGSHKQSARMLHLHTNTVAYRVARIEAITGLALGDPDDRLIAHVAVKITESQVPLRVQPPAGGPRTDRDCSELMISGVGGAGSRLPAAGRR